MDILAHFRALLRDVDTSLIDEWESMNEPGRPRAIRAARATVDPAAERRALQAAIRAELHKLVRALARKDYAGASRLLSSATANESWTAERLTTEMAPFWAAHTELLMTPAARRPDRTRIDEIEPGRLRAQQTLVDAEGDEDWSLDCTIETDAAGGQPVLQLQRIGI